MSSVDIADRPPARHLGVPLVVLVVGLVVFGGVAVACYSLARQAEDRLLQERTEEASAALSLSVANVRAPLDSAATLARVSGGDPAFFASALEDQIVGEGSFSGAALIEFGSGELLASVGAPLSVGEQGAPDVAAVIEQTSRSASQFAVIDLLQIGRRLGYSVIDDAESPRYVVYAERVLSPDPTVRRRNDEPFRRLDYLIYLGSEQPDDLLGGSTEPPLGGRTARASSSFGDQELLLVMRPTEPLNGWFFSNLWWMVALVGALVSVGAAGLAQRLRAGRDIAETLAADNARLYTQQFHIAETLQLSLLPQHLTAPDGVAVAARYWPAEEASLIGGDFYDVFRVDDTRWAVVIGDVCGKGIEAAAITGLVRHTARASARTSVSPSTVLRDIHDALTDHRPTTFCTVCFVYVQPVDDGRHQLTLALGGHPPPLLRRHAGDVSEVGEPGTLLGVIPPVLADVMLTVETGDTLLLYTDGLTDAPPDLAVPIEEVIELLERQGGGPVEQVVDEIRPLKRRRRPLGSTDDTALLLVRF